MYDIFDPCPEEITNTTIQQRIDTQSNTLTNVVENLYTTIAQAIAEQAFMLSPIIKLLKQRIGRQIKATEKAIDTVKTVAYDRILSMVTENSVRLNQVAAELERFENERQGIESQPQSSLSGLMQSGRVDIGEAERIGEPQGPSALDSAANLPIPPAYAGPSALNMALDVQELTRPLEPGYVPPEPRSALGEIASNLTIPRQDMQPQSEFPVDMDQPRAWRFWPGDADWKQRAIQFEGEWLRDFDNATTIQEFAEKTQPRVEPSTQPTIF